ncbi:glutaredoxin [Reinekea sp.]|jgi:monothiol glutaredoxin|uniref:glutaredoxin n=1 Tax=Reinekea sp. TaxID=1970455 RepID=UPI003989341C
MTRRLLAIENVHTDILKKLGGGHTDVVDEVIAAVEATTVVVVGMKQNPFVKKARKLLDAQNVSFKYLEYGSYFNFWKPRLAIKMWSGFNTFPQVFVNGTLIGGYSDTKRLVESGALTELLKTSD